MIDYLFSLSPGVLGGSLIYSIFFLGGAFLLFRFLIPFWKRRSNNKALQKVLSKSRTGSLLFGLFFPFLGWMRFEQVPFLSMRIWVFVLLLASFLWVLWKIRSYLLLSRRIHSAEHRRKEKLSDAKSFDLLQKRKKR